MLKEIRQPHSLISNLNGYPVRAVMQTLQQTACKIMELKDMLKASISDLASAYSKTSYRPEVDGLRALAVIAVIINHFNKDILPSGYLGVDIFFVISGFVITSSLAGRSSKGIGDFMSGASND